MDAKEDIGNVGRDIRRVYQLRTNLRKYSDSRTVMRQPKGVAVELLVHSLHHFVVVKIA